MTPPPRILENDPLRLFVEADDVRTRVPQKMGISSLDAPLKHLADAKVVQEYPQMWDVEGAHIAQYEHTVICKQAKEVLSQCNEWGVAPTIRYLLESLKVGHFCVTILRGIPGQLQQPCDVEHCTVQIPVLTCDHHQGTGPRRE